MLRQTFNASWFLFSVLIGIMVTSSCHKENVTNPNSETNVTIAVIADPHYFDPTLLKDFSVEFESNYFSDRKLIAESDAILNSVTETLIGIRPSIILVAGDLTKDGEKISHQGVAANFKKLEDAGCKVFITPGNHDVNNPDAVSYDHSGSHSVENITPSEFKSVYADFGYTEALEPGPGLSYLAEASEGILILSIDVCRYRNNNIHQDNSGGFTSETLEWATEKIAEAKEQGKMIFGLMHHGMLEHFPDQKTMFESYVIDDWNTISATLANAGLKVVFTGHFHSQDIVKRTTDSGFIFDIETGSIVSYPCPYRIINYTADNRLVIKSYKIESVSYSGIPSNINFQEYARDHLDKGLNSIAIQLLTGSSYNLSTEQAAILAPVMAETFMAHYQGDEGEPSSTSQYIIDNLLQYDDSNAIALGNAILSIWNDTDPADNDITIDLKTGIAY